MVRKVTSENESLQLRNKVTPGGLSPFQLRMCLYDLYVKKQNQNKQNHNSLHIYGAESLYFSSVTQ